MNDRLEYRRSLGLGTSGFKGMDEPRHIDIVFDGPPGHEAGRFVEVENADGKSINFGEWVKRQDGLWALRIPAPDDL